MNVSLYNEQFMLQIIFSNNHSTLNIKKSKTYMSILLYFLEIIDYMIIDSRSFSYINMTNWSIGRNWTGIKWRIFYTYFIKVCEKKPKKIALKCYNPYCLKQLVNTMNMLIIYLLHWHIHQSGVGNLSLLLSEQPTAEIYSPFKRYNVSQAHNI